MSDTLIYDIEANGLNPDTIWVICAKELDSDETFTITYPQIDPGRVGHLLGQYGTVVCHNQLDYDRPVLRDLLGYVIPFGNVFDTLVASRLSWPDRPQPRGLSPKEGGPHSLAAWGVRLGIGKPKHEDWSQLSDDMIHRCQEDVKINEAVYKSLIEELYS